jgi:hypothetical protein
VSARAPNIHAQQLPRVRVFEDGIAFHSFMPEGAASGNQLALRHVEAQPNGCSCSAQFDDELGDRWQASRDNSVIQVPPTEQDVGVVDAAHGMG